MALLFSAIGRSDTYPSGVQYIALCGRLHHLWLTITPARRCHASDSCWSYPQHMQVLSPLPSSWRFVEAQFCGRPMVP